MEEAWGPLLERADEVGRIGQLLGRAREGRGCVALIEGAAGIGKTSVLSAARELAADDGYRILLARGGLLDRDLPWNVVRQLFRDVISAEDRQRDRLLSGAAELARTALGLPGDVEMDESGALHGLYWLTDVLAAEQPLLLAVDDVHWADLASLRYLSYAAQRIDDLPVLLAVTIRLGEPEDAHLRALRLHGVENRIALRQLSQPATTTLTRSRLGEAAAEEFCAACHHATGGNPFMLHELLLELAADGRAPTAAAAAEVAGITPESVKRSVLLRLSQLRPAAQELAKVVALLGAESELREAAPLAGLTPDEAATAADVLASAGILASGSPVSFVHPLVGEVIYNDVPAHERARRHRDAARKLAELGAGRLRIAAQLERTEPAGDRWVVEALHDAALESLAGGAPQPAVVFLRRALAEPPTEDARLSVLLGLARAESLTGSAEAIEHLQAALGVASDSATYAAIGVELMFMLFRHGQMQRAVELAHDLLERVPPGQRGLELRVIAAGATGAVLVPSLRSEMEFFIDRIPEGLAGETPEERLALSARLAAAFISHTPMEEAGDIAERALGNQMLLADLTSNELLFWNAASGLVVADRFDAARASVDAAVQDSRDRGSAIGFALSSAFRCLLSYRVGDIREGLADGRQALETVGPEEFQIYVYVVAFLLDCLIEAGQLEEALRLANRPELSGPLPDVFAVQLLRVARARARIVAEDAEAGIEEILDVGGSVVMGPAMLPWRSRAAAGLVAVGKTAEARALVQEELALGRSTRSGWAQAVALQALALADPDGAPAALDEALVLSERHGFALERARSLVLLGAHHRRRGERRRAEELLNDGLEAAVACGALALADRARAELVAIGLTPRRRSAEASDALTPAERRVAELAIGGMSNREIAQALFVSRRTVETHLTHVYQKLGIESRGQLGAALAERSSAAA